MCKTPESFKIGWRIETPGVEIGKCLQLTDKLQGFGFRRLRGYPAPEVRDSIGEVDVRATSEVRRQRAGSTISEPETGERLEGVHNAAWIVARERHNGVTGPLRRVQSPFQPLLEH